MNAPESKVAAPVGGRYAEIDALIRFANGHWLITRATGAAS